MSTKVAERRPEEPVMYERASRGPAHTKVAEEWRSEAGERLEVPPLRTARP
jgi:hypothetical protein